MRKFFNNFFVYYVLYYFFAILLLFLLPLLVVPEISLEDLVIDFFCSYDFWLIDEASVCFSSFWDYVEFSWDQTVFEHEKLEKQLKELQELRAKAKLEKEVNSFKVIFVRYAILIMAGYVIITVIKVISGKGN